MMKNYILIMVFQILFNIFKVLEIKYTYENKLNKLLLNSVWINVAMLTSTYYSLDSLFKGDYLGAPFFIAGSVLGKWFAMSHYENIRAKLFAFFKKKENEIS